HLLNALENERNELKHINGELERQKRDSHASFEKASVKVDVALSGLVNAIASTMMERKQSSDQGEVQKNFMYQCTTALNEVLEIDALYTRELERLCLKLFPPDHVKNMNAFDGQRTSEEIERLASLYPKTERNYIESDIDLERLSTYLRVLDHEITRIDHYDFDNNSLELMQERNASRTTMLNAQILEILNTNIEPALVRLAETDIQAPVTAADYNARYSQQHSVNEQLDMVLNLLTTQYAWSQFLLQSLVNEFEKQETLHQYLRQLHDDWQKRREDFENRMALTATLEATEGTATPTVVESHDTFLLSMKKLLMLDLASKLTEANHATPIAPKTRSLFTFYQYLKERVEKFGRNRSNFSANITDELETQTNFVRACEEIERDLSSCLHKNSKTLELLLSPMELSDLQLTLRAMTNKLQPSLIQFMHHNNIARRSV
ncbi:6602_t:CDS:10, partial [Paraglomus occultum]